jgi:hypothetical protein
MRGEKVRARQILAHFAPDGPPAKYISAACKRSICSPLQSERLRWTRTSDIVGVFRGVGDFASYLFRNTFRVSTKLNVNFFVQ